LDNEEKRYPIAGDRASMKTAVDRNADLGDVDQRVDTGETDARWHKRQVGMRSIYCAFIMTEETVKKLSQNIFFIT